MTEEQLNLRMQLAVADCEVMAVVAAMRSGKRPYVGEILEYYLPGSVASFSSRKRSLPYRFPVEPWHLSAAEKLNLPK